VRLHQQPLGFRTEGVATVPLTMSGIESPDEWRRRAEAMRTSLADAPGVSRATYALSTPLQFTGGGRCCWFTNLSFPGVVEQARAAIHAVDADYFDVFDLHFLAGTEWSRAVEGAAERPAVLTEPLALDVFGSAGGAVGTTFTLNDLTFRVIGVVADHRHYGPDQDHGPAVFVPPTALPFPPHGVHLAVLTAGAAPLPVGPLRDAIWRVEPDLPVPTVQPMSAWAADATARSRFESALVATFAGVALLLVALGLAGTLLYNVSLQRRNLGIRLALGATAARLERHVLRHGISMAVLGAAIGAAAAWATGRLIESRLYGVDARDVRTLALATGVLLAVAVVASWLPAQRAARTDPLESLRVE
jgi:putative ABC transport system permease protein